MKKVVSFLLSLVIVTTMIFTATFSVSAYSVPDENGFAAKLSLLRSQFPNGGYYSGTYYENGTAKAWECHGYALECFEQVFGIQYYNSGFYNRRDYSMGTIYAGDVVRTGNDSHTIFITKVDGDRIYYTDANYWPSKYGANYVRWDVSYTYSELQAVFTYKVHVPENYLTGNPTPQGHVMSESEGAGRTIPDGDYWIISKMAQDFFVDIPGNDTNTQNGCNIQAWKHDYPLPSKYDVFHFEYLNNGFYRITQYGTNMCLQVEGSSLYRGTNVHMWTEHGSIGAEWSIERSNMGYKIRARCNNYYLDIDNGKYENGTNIITWEYHEYNNQYYAMIPYAPDERPLANGLYSIKSNVTDNLFLDALGVPSEYKDGTNIDVWNGTNGEVFKLEYTGDGWYRIFENNSNLALEIKNEGATFLNNSTNAMLYSQSGSKGQLWKIRNNNDGTYSLINQMSGYYLDLEGANTENGTNVSQYQFNNSNSQKWKIYKIGYVMSESEGAGRTIPDGDYWICSKIASDYFLDISGDNYITKDGDNLTTWIWGAPYVPGEWDVFTFKYLNNGFYQITQKSTNMAMEVDGASLYCGSNVQMWTKNSSDAQQWSIEKTDRGYKFRCKCSGFYLDVYGGGYEKNTNMNVWEGNDSNAQFFGLIPYAPDEQPIKDGIYTIKSAVGDTCYLDIAGVPGDFVNHSNVQLWNWDFPEEQFKFEYVGNGYYKIYEVTSNLAVEILYDDASYLDKNKNAILYEKTTSRGQLWKIKKNSDGTYFFINQLSGYYLDVNDGLMANGTNIHINPYNGSNAQRWIPRRVISDDMVTVADVVTTSDATSVDPSVIVKVNNKTLTQNTDYSVDITADIADGKGIAHITGKGDYCGSITKEFSISILQKHKLGDTNLDGYITISDVTAIQRHLAELAVFTEEQLSVADTNGDGKVDISDATYLQKYLAEFDGIVLGKQTK